MSSPSSAPVFIKKVSREKTTESGDFLACEEPLEIRLVFEKEKQLFSKSVAVTMRTPGNDEELAVGFLFTEGIFTSKNDLDMARTKQTGNIIEIHFQGQPPNLEKLNRHFYTSSSCGVCGKSSIDAIRTTIPVYNQTDDLTISPEIIYNLHDLLRAEQSVFDQTGGLHASALFTSTGKMRMMKEDVGRHNALDKLIGEALLKDLLPVNQDILLLSGRASFELIQKAAMAGIRFVAAVGAPSSLAVETAKEFNITLIGFLRDQRFNIYCGSHRFFRNKEFDYNHRQQYIS